MVSPESTIATTEPDKWLIARLIGDFAPFQQYPELTQKYLAVPAQPPEHPRVQEGVKNWMIVDKTLVELDGLTCNKIGVSFEAFRTEYGACSNEPGSCLRNQLDDYYKVLDHK